MRLGDFELKQAIGSGGMGEIWHAEHGADRIPVAIKVIRSAASEEFREAFLHEVRLVAGLSHRNVILALDAGTVDEAAARGSEGRLTAGAPYLAMELAGGGSLAGVRVRRWDELKHVLLELLQALGHAHARGVVHRDLKPANLLLAAERSEIASKPRDLLSARVVLTDFGISTSRDAAAMFGEDAIGTPEFMAPEQVRGLWRDQGPWTDLYAVGVVAFRYATGRPPFKKANSTQTMLAHLREPVPPLEPIVEVPPGFEAFVRRLLAKDPADRFAYAGDARRALQALEDPLELDQGATRRMPAIRDVPATSGRARLVAVLDDADVPTEQNSAASDVSAITGGFGRPTGTGTGRGAWSPRAWTETDRRDLRLVGAGLGLYGLRPVPLVDRVSERDRLWGALVQVRTTGRAKVVVLRGPSGTGKSRLASWLAQTAHEAGAGITLEATLRAAGPDVVARLAIAALRCEGLGGVELRERVASYLGVAPEDPAVEALARVVAPRTAEAPLTEGERYVAFEDLVRRVAGERTALLWLDDAHLDQDALRLARRLLRVREPLSALVVLTIEDEALAERPDQAALLAELLAEPTAEVLPLGALGTEDHQELVRGLLGLEGSLAVRVEQTTAGNPLFAVQLVGDWIARGLLVPSDRGFRLTDPTASLPTDLLAVWEQRVSELLATRSPDDAHALELAAVLGLELGQVEFRRACRLAGFAPGLDLVGVSMQRGLARPVDDTGRWGFVHGMVREVLIRRSRASGRWQQLNAACAAWLRATPSAADPERLAAHLIAAGRPEEALDPLQQAIASRLAAGDVRSSSLISELEAALGALTLPADDARWGELWLSWAWLFRLRGEPQEAERWAVRCERAARRYGWPSLLARALRTGARIERNLGHLDQATEMIDEAEAIFQELGDRSRAAACRVLMGDVWSQRSDLPRAIAAFRSVLGATEDPVDEVEAWMGLARCAQRQGDVPAFTEALDRARDAAERAGNRKTLAAIANFQGELAREAGDLELAEQCYLESTRRHRALDDANSVYSELNVGVLQVLRGAWDEARARIEPLREREERGGVETIAACFARAVLLPSCAGSGDWSAFKEHQRWLEGYLGGRKVFDKDLARLAALAAELATRGNRPDGAVAAWKLAVRQYEGLGLNDQAATARAQLDALRS